MALLTHYNAVFIVAAWFRGGVVVLLRRGQARHVELGVAAAGLAIFALVLPTYRPAPDSGYANPNLVVPSAAEYLRQNCRHLALCWQEMLGGSTARLWGVAALAIAGIILSVMGGQSATCRRERLRLSLLVFWVAGGLVLYYIAVLDRGAFNVRYSSFITPALYALLGAGLAGWGRRVSVAYPLAAVLLLVGFAPAIRADLYDEGFAARTSRA